jgi:hypothetical protein
VLGRRQKAETLGQPLDRFGKGMLLTVTRQLQQRKHQGLEVRDSHIVHLPELRPEVLPPTPFTEARPSPDIASGFNHRYRLFLHIATF